MLTFLRTNDDLFDIQKQVQEGKPVVYVVAPKAKFAERMGEYDNRMNRIVRTFL